MDGLSGIGFFRSNFEEEMRGEEDRGILLIYSISFLGLFIRSFE